MLIALIQRPTEVAMGRKTILLDGTQVGYFHGPNKPLILTRHVSEEVAEFVKSEVQKLESCAVGKIAIPPESPPEWLEDEEIEDNSIVLP